MVRQQISSRGDSAASDAHAHSDVNCIESGRRLRNNSHYSRTPEDAGRHSLPSGGGRLCGGWKQLTAPDRSGLRRLSSTHHNTSPQTWGIQHVSRTKKRCLRQTQTPQRVSAQDGYTNSYTGSDQVTVSLLGCRRSRLLRLTETSGALVAPSGWLRETVSGWGPAAGGPGSGAVAVFGDGVSAAIA